MTDELAFQTCPKCGKENLSHMTHCVHCGGELEDLYHFDGQIELPEEETSDDLIASLPSIFDEIQTPPALTDDELDATETDPGVERGDPNAPDWLERVRERVRAEEDATGELTKGIHSMQDAVEGESKGDAESQYQAWLEEVREQAERKKAQQDERLKPSPVDDEGVPEWLRRIRALQPGDEGFVEPETTDEWTDEELEDLRRRELGDAYVPPEPEVSNEAETSEATDEDTQEIEIEHNIPEDDENLSAVAEETHDINAQEDENTDTPMSEDTGFIMVGDPKLNADEVFDTKRMEDLLAHSEQNGVPKIRPGKDDEKEALLQDLVILRGQHEKVALLKTLIGDEGKPLPSSGETKTIRKDYTRFFIGLAFILLLVLALIVIPKTNKAQAPVSLAQTRFGQHLDSLDDTDSVLVLMAYYSASAEEIEPLASPVLSLLEQKAVSWHALTLRMDGLWLADSLYEKAGLKDPVAPIYMPGGQFAMLDLAVRPDGEPQAGMQNLLPESMASLDDYQLVLLITDSSLTVRGWMEQVAPNLSHSQTLAIISQKEAVAIQPYFDSGQVGGYLSGRQGLPNTESPDQVNYRVYQVGLLLMTLLLILGIVLGLQKEAPQELENEVIA